MASETGFDRYFELRMRDPQFAAEYCRERRVIAAKEAIKTAAAFGAALGYGTFLLGIYAIGAFKNRSPLYT